jgi:hypothetical protein|tara:strand:- start:163 stop:420 length:258 start_codon:yes stop_codon:yes gene_type:complete
MSTDLREIPVDPNTERKILLNRSWGGNKYGGSTIAITTENLDYDERFLHLPHMASVAQLRLTRDEAKALAVELMLFGEGVEVERY